MYRSAMQPVRRGPESEAAEKVLALLRLGYTRGEIAEEMDVNANVVRRLIRRECQRRNTDVEGLRNLSPDGEVILLPVDSFSFRPRLDDEGSTA